MAGIWSGGAETYEEALRREYEAACARVQARLGCDDQAQEAQRVSEELRELKENYERRLKAIRRSLFGVR
jgi:hypothetical protein